MGIFPADCQEWNHRELDNKTLPHLKVFLAAVHREWRLLLQNDTGILYGADHNAATKLDDGYLQQETVEAIVNLATATASDRAAIAQLTATAKSLTAELFTVNAKLVAALQPQKASRGSHGGQTRGRGHGRGRGAGAGVGATTPTMVPRTSAVFFTRTDNQDLEPPIHYCWTFGPRCRRNSAKCPAPATGHIYAATKRDIQGGAEAQK